MIQFHSATKKKGVKMVEIHREISCKFMEKTLRTVGMVPEIGKDSAPRMYELN